VTRGVDEEIGEVTSGASVKKADHLLSGVFQILVEEAEETQTQHQNKNPFSRLKHGDRAKRDGGLGRMHRRKAT
jgi:hypothetical protein